MTVLRRLASLLVSSTPGRKRRDKEPQHQAQQPISLSADDGSLHTGKRSRLGSGQSAGPHSATAAGPSQVVDLTGDDSPQPPATTTAAAPTAAAGQTRVSQGSGGSRKDPQAKDGTSRAAAGSGTAAAAQPPASGPGPSASDSSMFPWCSL